MKPGEDAFAWVFDPLPRAAVSIAGEQAQFPVHRIYCVGQNYRAHAQEMGASGREPPFFFAKPADAVCQSAAIPFPSMTRQLHHEVELVTALGSGGRDIPVDQALRHVYGYAVGVDLTRRDLQTTARQVGRPWTTAKGFDQSAAISPLQPAARCRQPAAAAISLSVNGTLRQEGNTSEMIWSVPEIIAELSRYFLLQAGDLIFTGTPPGIGPLEPGDRVDCRIDGVASLRFEIVGG